MQYFFFTDMQLKAVGLECNQLGRIYTGSRVKNHFEDSLAVDKLERSDRGPLPRQKEHKIKIKNKTSTQNSTLLSHGRPTRSLTFGRSVSSSPLAPEHEISES